MHILKSFCIAFSMYSKLPMPQFNWEKEDLKYSICFFPLTGLVIGAAELLWTYICRVFEISFVPYSIVAAVIPVAISGGIHVDGYMDCSDAFSSYQDKEKKLEILKDAHIGAFAVIRLLVLAGICVALFMIISADKIDVSSEFLSVIWLGFALSRALSGISVVSFACAKSEGTLYTFAEGSDKKRCLRILVKESCIIALCMVLLGGIAGAAAAVAAFLMFLYYRSKAMKELGGITGDVAGWFVCLCEVWMAAAVCLAMLLQRSL